MSVMHVSLSSPSLSPTPSSPTPPSASVPRSASSLFIISISQLFFPQSHKLIRSTTMTESANHSSPSISPRAQPTAQPHITLKLKHSMADRANYSSSEEEEEGEEEQLAEDRLSPSPPPSKKKKLSSTPTKSSTASKGKQSIKLTLGPQHAHLRQPSSSSSTSAGSAANQGKKSYDWLQPSAAGASHSGPLERERERERSAHSPGDLPVPSASVASAASNSSTKSLGMSPAEEAIGGLLDESVDDNIVISSSNNNSDLPTLKKGKETVPKAKRSHHKKGSDAPPGPGKNWKKGMKKWVLHIILPYSFPNAPPHRSPLACHRVSRGKRSIQ